MWVLAFLSVLALTVMIYLWYAHRPGICVPEAVSRIRAAKVYAALGAKGAAELLEKRGTPFTAEKTVETILNHEKDGSCPMEKAVSGLDEPKKMIEAIRKAKRK